MVNCHHGMARLQVADRAEGLQIWSLPANILNKQSRTVDMGWSSSLCFGQGANNTLRKNPACYEMLNIIIIIIIDIEDSR
jgi:hypothetical protein